MPDGRGRSVHDTPPSSDDSRAVTPVDPESTSPAAKHAIVDGHEMCCLPTPLASEWRIQCNPPSTVVCAEPTAIPMQLDSVAHETSSISTAPSIDMGTQVLPPSIERAVALWPAVTHMVADGHDIAATSQITEGSESTVVQVALAVVLATELAASALASPSCENDMIDSANTAAVDRR